MRRPMEDFVLKFRPPPQTPQAASSLDWCTEEDRERILEVGFEWDEFGDGFKFDDVVAGLSHYETLYGELPDDDFTVGAAFACGGLGSHAVRSGAHRLVCSAQWSSVCVEKSPSATVGNVVASWGEAEHGLRCSLAWCLVLTWAAVAPDGRASCVASSPLRRCRRRVQTIAFPTHPQNVIPKEAGAGIGHPGPRWRAGRN